MKKSKRFLAILLSAMIAVSAVSAVSFSAAENDDTVSVEDSASVAVTEAPTVAATTVAVTQAPTTPPAPTVGKIREVEKTSFETDYITLKWDAVSGATGYYVYMCNRDESDSFKRVANVTKNTATIKNLAHTTQYWFKVSAYITKDGKTYEGDATLKKTAATRFTAPATRQTPSMCSTRPSPTTR